MGYLHFGHMIPTWFSDDYIQYTTSLLDYEIMQSSIYVLYNIYIYIIIYVYNKSINTYIYIYYVCIYI